MHFSKHFVHFNVSMKFDFFLEYFLHGYLIDCRRKNNLVLALYVAVVRIFISLLKGGSDENF